MTSPRLSSNPAFVFTDISEFNRGFVDQVRTTYRSNFNNPNWSKTNPIRLASEGIPNKSAHLCHYTAHLVFSIMAEHFFDDKGNKCSDLEQYVVQVLQSPEPWKKQLGGIKKLKELINEVIKSDGSKGLVCLCSIIGPKTEEGEKFTTIFHQLVVDFTPGKELKTFQSYAGVNSLTVSSQMKKEDFIRNMTVLTGKYPSKEKALAYQEMFMVDPFEDTSLAHGWKKAEFCFIPVIYTQKPKKVTPYRILLPLFVCGLIMSLFLRIPKNHFPF